MTRPLSSGCVRMVLSMGGNDITEFLYVLLEKIGFPYADIDLARSYDWNVMEELKARLCTLAEVKCAAQFIALLLTRMQGDVALNLYDFSVRRPGRETEKYGLRAYDEIILAPMASHDLVFKLLIFISLLQCLFEPRVIEFEQKRAGMRFLMRAPDMAEEMVEQSADKFSERYVRSFHIQTLSGVSSRTHRATDTGYDDFHPAFVPGASSSHYSRSCGAHGHTSHSDSRHNRRTVSRGDSPTGCKW